MIYRKLSFRNNLERFNFSRVFLLNRYKDILDSLTITRALFFISVSKVLSFSYKL